jgi:DNA-binding transcriptional LysR family regulator
MQAIAERNLRAVDLNLLVVFDALMTEKNLTRVGARHGLSQPAVSKALNRLRHLFEDPLFVRCDRIMEPTARAKELAGPIGTALQDISRTISRSSFDPSRVEARIRVASIDLYHTPIFPKLVQRLREQAPGVDLHVRALDSFRIREHLAAGEVDFAFSPFVGITSGFHAAPLWNDQLVTLVGAHRRGDRPLTLDGFAAASHVVDAGHVHVAPDGNVSSVVDTMLGARGLKRRIALVLPAASGLPHIVAATDLIATLPRCIVVGLGELKGVVLQPLPLDIQVRPHLVWHERTQLDPLLSWVRELVGKIAVETLPTSLDSVGDEELRLAA